MMFSNYRFFLLFLLLTSKALAMTPVIDISMIKQMIVQMREMKKTYNLLNLEYQTEKAQLEEIRTLSKSMRGHSHFGEFMNDISSLSSLHELPKTWDHAMKGLSGNNPERYKALMKSYLANNKALSTKEMGMFGVNEKTSDYKQQLHFVANAKIQSSHTYDMVDTYLKRIKSLSKQIDSTQNIKSAMDLNSRLLIEISYLTTEEIRMQALLNHQLSETQSRQLKIDGDAMKYIDYHEKQSGDFKDD